MQQILSYWEYILGGMFVILMLWWVIDRDGREKRKYERAVARKLEHEEHRRNLEEWVGWDGLNSK